MLRDFTSMHVFPASANDCILQTNSFGLVTRHIFRPTNRNSDSLSLTPLVSTCTLLSGGHKRQERPGHGSNPRLISLDKMTFTFLQLVSGPGHAGRHGDMTRQGFVYGCSVKLTRNLSHVTCCHMRCRGSLELQKRSIRSAY